MTRSVVNALAVVSVVALLGFTAFSYGRRVDARACEYHEQLLRSLLALDFRLSAEVMKARSGLIAHYDGIVQTEAAQKRTLQALQELPYVLRMSGPSRLQTMLQESERARRAGGLVVERFKREHAVLRNSLRFLPVAASELDRPSTAGLSEALRWTITELIRDALLLQKWPDGVLLQRIDRSLAMIADAVARPLGPDGDVLATVLTHARIVRERTPIVQELTRRIAAADGSQGTQAMMAEFHDRRQAATRIGDRDASVRYALALVAVLAIAASIILRLRHAAHALQLTSDELTKALSSLRLEQEKQKELSELKSRFVSMASHEFRTPLSVIMSSSELLEAYGERWSSTKKQGHFSRIRQASLAMTRMLDAVLMIGRRDAGLLKFEPRPLEVRSFCSELLDAVASVSGQGRRVTYHGLASEERVMADPTLLRQALENLLSNALKYSPTDTSVELRVARENGELRFDVWDRGIGISADDQRRLFETFHRGANVGEISGTGLGLCIARGAVELHGGSISVQSTLSAGSQFTVRIPCMGGTG